MTVPEAVEWLRGNRSTAVYMSPEPSDTWHVRVAQADAARMQQAYYIVTVNADALAGRINQPKLAVTC